MAGQFGTNSASFGGYSNFKGNAPRKLSGLAVTGLILPFFGLSIPGLILSIISLKNINNNNLRGRGIATTGITISSFYIFMIIISITIIFLVYNSSFISVKVTI